MIKVKNIIAFLKHKGWTLDEVTDTHYLMKPPKSLHPNPPDARFHLVREVFEGTPYYEEHTRMMTNSVATLYDLNFDLLVALFSKTPAEIKAVQEISSELVAGFSFAPEDADLQLSEPAMAAV